MADTGSLEPYGGSDRYNENSPQQGRMAKEDGEWVNVAGLFENISNNPEFLLQAQMGMIDGLSIIDKFGINPEITTGTDPEDVIEQGGCIVYDAIGTAPIKYLSSSDILDTGQTISILGQDINRNEIEQTLITDGQDVVELPIPLWRAYRMENNSDEGKDINGVLYLHIDDTPISGVPALIDTRVVIINGKNQTLFAGYTIPLGKVGFLLRGELGLELEGNSATLAEYAHCHYESRRLGKCFKVKKSTTIFPGCIYVDKRTAPDILPSGTDIKLVASIVTQTMGIWGTFDILLVDESKFTTEYLQKIGQPGY